MATYYISPSGSNANNGLGPDASAGTNKPWLTLAKALNSGSTVVAGDTIYVAPGYYYSSALTPLATISSSGSPTKIIGDPTNKQGFKDGSGVLLAPGIPFITTRTAAEGNDSDIASAGVLFTANTNNPSGLQFSFLLLECGGDNAACAVWQFSLAAGSDNSFNDCILWGRRIMVATTSAPTAGRNLALNRCTLYCREVLALSTTTAAATADANLNITLQSCLIFGGVTGGTNMALGSSGGNLGGGININDCTQLGEAFIVTVALRVSTVAPVTYKGCNVHSYFNSTQINAGTTGQVIDGGYNRKFCGSADTNCTLAGTSIKNPAPNFVLPHLVTWGLELPRADFLGWSDAAHSAQRFSGSGSTALDFRGRTPKPWGSGASIGYMESGLFAEDTGSTISTGGANSLKITGAGEISFFVPVDASAMTISVITKSGSYGGTNWPQLIVVANGSIGLAADVVVTASSASEQTLTSASFTPTAKGIVEIRLVSRSTSATSTTNFDQITSP